MKVVIAIVAWIVAFFGSVIYFSTSLSNESHPALPWIVCPIVYAVAGAISGNVSGGNGKDYLKWIGWSVVVSLVAAALFTVAK